MKIGHVYLDYGNGWTDYSKYVLDDITYTERMSSDTYTYAQNVANFKLLIGTEPEIPDDPAGTTYKQDDWLTVDGWGYTWNCTLSVANGKLVIEATQPDFIFKHVFDNSIKNKIVRANISMPPGSLRDVFRVYYTDGTNEGFSLNWEGDIGTAIIPNNPDKTISYLGIEAGGGVGTYYLDWIYIGTGSWLSNYDILKSVDNIKVQITDINNIIKFTGIIEHVPSLEYDGIYENNIIAVEAVDSINKLDITYEDTDDPANDLVMFNAKIMDSTTSANSIIHQMLYRGGFTNDDIASDTINVTVSGFVSDDTSSIISQIDTLLREYGYVARMNSENKFSPMKWLYQPEDLVFVATLDEELITNKISISVNKREYEGVKLQYYENAWKYDVLLYRENLPIDSSTGEFTGYFIPSGTYYPIEANVLVSGLPTIIYQEYTDSAIKALTNEAIVNNLDYDPRTALQAFKSDYSSIVATSGHYLTTSGTNITLVSGTFYNKKARVLYKASDTENGMLYVMNIYGDVLYKKAEQTIELKAVPTTRKYITYTSKYLDNYDNAYKFANGLLNLYYNGNENYVFESDIEYSVGSFVKLKLKNFDEVICIILQKSFDNVTQLFTYTCKSYITDSHVLNRKSVKNISDIAYRDDIISGIKAYWNLDELLNTITSDSIISITEKPSVFLEWNRIVADYPLVRARAIALGLPATDTKIVDFDNAYNALNTYLNVSPGILVDMTQPSNIVKTEFVLKFADYTTAREAIESGTNRIEKALNSLTDPVDFNGQYGIYGGVRYKGVMPNTWTVDDKSAIAARVFYTTPTVPYAVGDLWIKDNALFISTVDKPTGEFSELDWEWCIRSNITTVIESSNGDVFKPTQSMTTILTPRCFRNGLEITSTIPDSAFCWTRVSFYPQSPPNDDATWNANHAAGYRTIEITADSIYARATYTVAITM